jgi:hypothetical protein
MPELEGVLTVKNKDKQLIAIVHRDDKNSHQVFYKVTEMGVDDIKSLLEDIHNVVTQ